MIVPPIPAYVRLIEFAADCPGCGTDATWVHRRPSLYDDELPEYETYTIRCEVCG